MRKNPPLEHVLRHDRILVLAALSAVVLLAVLYTVFGVGMNMSALEMTTGSMGEATAMGGKTMQQGGMAAMAMPAAWTPGYAVLVFFMWWIMMIAMMVPSAAPTVLLYSALTRKSAQANGAPRLTFVFLSGYLVVWAGFSLLATAAQWLLELNGYVSPMMMVLVSNTLAGIVLLVAGLYQFTPLKDACLNHCRSPLAFLIGSHRPGAGGAFRMGLEHGAFCLGCCWFLMALLFVGGIMNLYWIAGLAIYVAVEKLAPSGRTVGRVAGVAMAAGGLWLLGQSYL